MNHGPLLFLGIFLTLASSFWGLVLAPQLQIGRQTQRPLEAPGQFYPAARSGQAKQGADVYRSLGCAECHSQQVRALAGDLKRGWGKRISVAQDYLWDDPVLLGNSRLGPDLANFGTRNVNEFGQLLQHLYNPKLVIKGSPMPRYPFLFEKRPVRPGQRAPLESLPMQLEENQRRYWLVPKESARTLVAYLLSLKSDLPLFEAPVPQPKTNAPPTTAGVTNAPATNAPPTNAPSTSLPATNMVSTNPISTNAAPAKAASTNPVLPTPASTNAAAPPK